MDSFDGFPQETFSFFSELKENNNKEWFLPRKKHFNSVVLEPAARFVEVVGSRLQEVAPAVQYDSRTSGLGSIARIYRDVRFSKDKRPYKSHQHVNFWVGQGKKSESPGFYFGFDASEGGLAAGMWSFSKPLLASYRSTVDDPRLSGALVELLRPIIDSASYELKGQSYKRVPRGYPADHPRGDLLRHSGLFASGPALSVELMTSPDIVDVVMDHFGNLAPLVNWLASLEPAG